MPALCELSDVKDWLTIDSGNVTDDPLLERLIAATSDDFLNCLNRSDFLPAQNYVEYRQGFGTQDIYLLHYPMNYVTAVNIDGFDVPRSLDGQCDGYWWDPSNDAENAIKLTLIGFQFTNWWNWLQRAFPNWTSTNQAIQRNNVIISYNAGYAVEDVEGELWTIPIDPGPYAVRVLQSRHFDEDEGVIYVAGSVALVEVAANPTVGQYSVDANGNYTFNAGDAGQAIAISYSVTGIPPAIQQAVIDWVCYRYKMRGSIGQSVKRNAAGDSTTFNNVLMPLTTASVCQKYQRMQF